MALIITCHKSCPLDDAHANRVRNTADVANMSDGIQHMNDFFGHGIGSRIAAYAGFSQAVVVADSQDSDLFQAVAVTHAVDDTAASEFSHRNCPGRHQRSVAKQSQHANARSATKMCSTVHPTTRRFGWLERDSRENRTRPHSQQAQTATFPIAIPVRLMSQPVIWTTKPNEDLREHCTSPHRSVTLPIATTVGPKSQHTVRPMSQHTSQTTDPNELFASYTLQRATVPSTKMPAI
jgi:hypothetical protein